MVQYGEGIRTARGQEAVYAAHDHERKKMTISEGYSGRRFQAEITGAVFAKSIEGIFRKVPFGKINPVAKTRREALRIAKDTCGNGDGYVAINIRKI